MKKFAIFLLLVFLPGCGVKSSPPPDTLTVTKYETKQQVQVWLQSYQDPDEPDSPTVGGLIEYIGDQRAVNAKHNSDKTMLRKSDEAQRGKAFK